MMLFLKLWWKPLAGVAAVLTLLMLYRAQIAKAEARGWERATIEATIAAAEAARAYQAQVDAAEGAQIARQKAREARLAPIRQKVTDYAKTAPDCPDALGRSLLNEAIRSSNDSSPARPRN